MEKLPLTPAPPSPVTQAVYVMSDVPKETVAKIMADYGRIGGKSRSAKKVAASQRNIAKATATRCGVEKKPAEPAQDSAPIQLPFLIASKEQ